MRAALLAPTLAAAITVGGCGGPESSAAEVCDITDETAVSGFELPNEPAIVVSSGQGKHGEVRELVEGGADPDATDSVGHTPLWYAAWRGCPETVQTLLDLGADPDAGVPLIAAAESDQLEIAGYLLDACADPGVTNNLGTPASEITGDPALKSLLEEAAAQGVDCD